MFDYTDYEYETPLKKNEKFDGCDPEIEYMLKKGLYPVCHMYKNEFNEDYKRTVVDYSFGTYFCKIPGCDRLSEWINAKIVKKKLFIKSAMDIMRILTDKNNGYSICTDGSWVKDGCNSFVPNMWYYCGMEKSQCEDYSFEPEWLEER